MKCFLCWLIGHKWWITNLKTWKDDNGYFHRDRTHIKATNCQRCGESNPDKTTL
jgi:hypothetical protein